MKDIYKRAYLLGDIGSWQIKYGSLHGQIETDLLTSDLATIEVQFFNIDDGKFFILQTKFKKVVDNLVFNPSLVYVKLFNGLELVAKGLDCPYAKQNIDLQNFQFQPELKGWIDVRDKNCLVLSFDHPAPPMEEEFVVYMDGSLTHNGNAVEVPPICFRKTVKNIHRWGFIQ